MRFFILNLFNILCYFNNNIIIVFTTGNNAFNGNLFYSYVTRHKRNAVERGLEPPRLINMQRAFVTSLSDNTRVYCTATGNPSPRIKWFYETSQRNVFTEVIDGMERFAVGTNGDLDIFLQTNPEVQIYCKAQNELGTVRSKTITVHKWQYNKDVKIIYDSKEIFLYQKAVINCMIEPKMFTNIHYVRYWEIRFKSKPKNVQKIYETGGRFSVINRCQPPQLHIRNVTKADFTDLEVRCRMRNIYTEIDVKSDEWVSPKKSEYDSGKMDYSPLCKNLDVRVIKGTTLELPWCSAPKTHKIVWYWSSAATADKQPVNLSGPKFQMISEIYGNLLIKNIGIAEEGLYYAFDPMVSSNPMIPRNSYLIHTVRIMINVSVDVKPPVVNARYNEVVKLKCVAVGYPKPSLFWLYNGNEFNSSKSIETSTISSRTSIITIHVNIATTGVYQCLAESRDSVENRILSEDQRSVFVIIAEMAPVLISQSPSVKPSDSYGTGVLRTDRSLFQIRCEFNRVPNGTVAWYLDDQKIPMVTVLIPNTTYKLPYTVIARLQIDLSTMASIEDKWKYGGEYRAEVTNEYGKAHCTTLIFVTDEYKIRDYQDITLTHGAELRLKCYVISGSKPTIEWFRDVEGKLVRLPETHTQTVSEDGRLFIIEKVDKVIHSGKYMCISTLNNQKISKTYSVTIANPPIMLSELPDSISLNKNSDSTSLTCLPRHQPDLPWYAWWEFKDAKSNHSVPLLVNSYHNANDLKIEIKYQKITVSEKFVDNGAALPKGVPIFVRYHYNKIAQIWIKYNEKLHLSQISCVVQNHAGIIRKIIQISIDNLAFKESPPLDYSIVLGKSFALNCTAKPNNIQLKTIWFNLDSQNNVAVNSTVESRIHQLPNGTLVVKDIQLTDPRKFMCIIKSTVSKDEISKVVKIAIKVPATILNMPDIIDMKRNNRNSLNCTVHGDDELNVKWYRKKDDEWMLITSSKVDKVGKVSQFIVEFDSVTDSESGEYKCVASNEHRKNGVEKVIQLNVVDVPGKVIINEESIRSSSRAIDISWSFPDSDGKKPITGYLVMWKLRTENNFINKTVIENFTTIKSLRPFKEYKLVVVAQNSVGYGEEATITRKTNADAPEGPVLHLVATPVSFEKVVLKWVSPNEALVNGIKKYYQVCSMEIYDSKNLSLENLTWPFPNDTTTRIIDPHNNRVKKSCINVPESSLEVVVSELLTFTEYAFRVILINNVGFSPATYVAIRTLEDRPDGLPIQVLCTPKGDYLSLEWNPPPQNETNGVISGYEVTYFSDDKQEEPDKLMKNVTETHLILKNLSANSKYIIQIRVKNNIGLGPPSLPINCTTNEAAPEAPNEIKAFYYNDCLNISWTPPIKTNGNIRNYKIRIPSDSIHTELFPRNDRPYNSFSSCEHICKNCKVAVSALTTTEGPSKTVDVQSDRNGILSFSQSLVVQNASQLVLDCELVSQGESRHYRWTHNNNVVDMFEPNGSLVIHSMTDNNQGTYKCQVNSEEITYNISMKSISLVPQTPYIEITKVSTHQIGLLWRSNGFPKTDDPINQFLVDIQYVNGTSAKKSKFASNIRSIDISDLECGTLYNVFLYAKNIAGKSDPAISKAQTRGSIPEIPDTSNIVAEIGSHSMCFNLRAFRPGLGCPANRYLLKLQPSSRGHQKENSDPVSKVVNDSDLNKNSCFNVTDLHPNTDYEYAIEASNMVGSQKAKGHNKTLQISSTVPPNIKYSSSSPGNDFKYIFVGGVGVAIVLFLLIVIVALYFSRKSYQTCLVNRNISNNLVRPPPPVIQSPISVSNNRNRKLPTPPDNNLYDKGTNEITKPPDNEEDEMLMPYATYESIPKPDPMTSRDRPNKMLNYNNGSQAHSYQYPEMLPQETSIPKSMNYQNDLKQPLLNHPIKHRQYDKGYSRGSEPLGTLRPQTVRSEALATSNKQRVIQVLPIAPGSMESEAYRPSSSLCSSTTESSTKDELSQFFRNTSGNQFHSRLQEQDEDGASTARGGNRSTLINRSHHHINNTLSDDSTQPESYCESGSSGDDCGIRMFTQDPPGQQVIAPQTIRNMNPRCNSLPYDTANRQPFIQQSTNFTLQQPRNPLPEEDEGEEANNYTNNFVVV